jgi:regulator of sigma D
MHTVAVESLPTERRGLEQHLPGADLSQEILQGRGSVLSYLLKLNKCIDAQHADLVHAVMQRFSESLIDYISFGHFRLFATHQPQPHHLVALDNITQRVMAFNDAFTNVAHISLKQLKASLEELAIALEVQFEIEDEVMAFEKH